MLAGLLLTGCMEGDYGIKPEGPQTNPKEPTATIPDLTASAVAPIDLAKVEGESVSIVTVTPVTVDGATVDYAVILDGTHKVVVDAEGKAETAELQELVTGVYGKAPVAREFDAVLNGYIKVDGQSILLQSGKFKVTVTPSAPFIDAGGYYLIGNMNDWNGEKARDFKFKHSGKDVYEDSQFSIVVSVDAGCYWKIIPDGNYIKGNVWEEGPEGVVGVATDGDDAAEGILVTDKPQAAKIPEAGLYKITIDMMEYTYKVAPMASEYYLVGALNGWNANADGKYCLLYPEGSNVFSFTTNWTDAHNFKVWSGDDYGNWDLAVGNPEDGNTDAEGTLGGGGAICTPATGLYTVTFDMAANTYKSVALENQEPAEYGQISLVGDFNGWGGEPDIDLKAGAPHNWYVLGVEIPVDGGLKFRVDHDWGMNWGPDADLSVADVQYGTGVKDGKNITVPAGTYDVFFNDITGQFVFLAR